MHVYACACACAKICILSGVGTAVLEHGDVRQATNRC